MSCQDDDEEVVEELDKLYTRTEISHFDSLEAVFTLRGFSFQHVQVSGKGCAASLVGTYHKTVQHYLLRTRFQTRGVKSPRNKCCYVTTRIKFMFHFLSLTKKT